MNTSPIQEEQAQHPWRCPECGSTDLRVFYNERRCCGVTTDPNADPDDPRPYPSYTVDEFVEVDYESCNFICDACGADDIQPTREVRP